MVISAKRLVTFCLVLVVLAPAGCSKSQLSRFAPPGIVKYEDIAGEKPPNPAIEAMLAERKENTNAVFPVISQTPGRSDRPEPISQQKMTRQIEELEAIRDDLNNAVDQDRRDAEADSLSADAMRERRDNVAADIDVQSGIAKRERTKPLKQE